MDTNVTPPITIFDATLREGELVLNAKLTIQRKIQLALQLEAIGVDVIEVGYPGAYRRDSDAIFMVSKRIKQATVSGLAGSKADEIASVAVSLKPAGRGRINVFTSTNPQGASQIGQTQTLDVIRDSVVLARNYRDDVQWTAFDATRSQPDFLCRSIETAIHSGATTVTIADSLGVASPESFAHLLETVMHRVSNIEQATIGVHCHDDRGFALENSLLALDYGIRQIECSMNGLGARKGNANLAAVVQAIYHRSDYTVNADFSLFDRSFGFS
jgi:2-isopropylmalate synthase